MTLVLIGCLVLLAVAKSFYPQQYIDIIKLAGADRFLTARSKGSYFFQPLPLVLLCVQFISISLIIHYVYCASQGISPQDNSIIYAYVLLYYSVFEIVKISLERFLGFVLNIEVKMRPYFYKKITVKNWIGLFLLAGCFILVFTADVASFVVQILIGLAVFIYGIYNIWLLSSYSKLFLRFPFYFILYFCALEIAPYFILYKYFTRF